MFNGGLYAVAAGFAGNEQHIGLVEMVEIDNHTWYVTCQFHPEFTSSPRDGHPLFTGFVRAAGEEIIRRQGVPRAANA